MSFTLSSQCKEVNRSFKFNVNYISPILKGGHNEDIDKAFLHLLFSVRVWHCCKATQINKQEVIMGLKESPLGSRVGE